MQESFQRQRTGLVLLKPIQHKGYETFDQRRGELETNPFMALLLEQEQREHPHLSMSWHEIPKRVSRPSNSACPHEHIAFAQPHSCSHAASPEVALLVHKPETWTFS